MKIKTKKDILNWWIDLGVDKDKEKENYKVVMQGWGNHKNDLQKFWDVIDSENVAITSSQKGCGEKQEHKLVLMSANWKYPLKLYFYNLECYRIVGF